MASTSARKAGTSAVRSPALPHRTGGGSWWRGAARTARPLRPRAAARATSGLSCYHAIAPLANQSGMAIARGLHALLLAVGDRTTVVLWQAPAEQRVSSRGKGFQSATVHRGVRSGVSMTLHGEH